MIGSDVVNCENCSGRRRTGKGRRRRHSGGGDEKEDDETGAGVKKDPRKGCATKGEGLRRDREKRK